MTPHTLSPRDQFTGLCILDYLIDLFQAPSKPAFTGPEVVSILRCVRAEGDIFSPVIREAYDRATAFIDGEPS